MSGRRATYKSADLIGWAAALHAGSADDLYLTVGLPPTLRGSSGFMRIDDVLAPEDMRSITGDMLDVGQQAGFSQRREMNTMMDLDTLGIGRFRVNFAMQRGNPMIVMRRISSQVPTMQSLDLPEELAHLACAKRGLVVVTGATGSGKSTTQAAMIDHRNKTMEGHILTIEDPIEYVHEHRMSIVNQREVGKDTLDFKEALKQALRQRPDVILVGEVRETDVMHMALVASETGHLAQCTLHAATAAQTVDRIANFFGTDDRRQALLSLSFNLQAIVAQRLVRTPDGGRVAALELLLCNETIRRAVRTGDTPALQEMVRSGEGGSWSFDTYLGRLHAAGRIDGAVLAHERSGAAAED